jgi:hypothetical protein
MRNAFLVDGSEAAIVVRASDHSSKPKLITPILRALYGLDENTASISISILEGGSE